MSRKIILGSLGLAAGIGLAVVAPASNATAAVLFECADASHFCLDAAGGATYTADKRSTSKDQKKRTLKSAGSLSITVENGRGSVFVNGRYAGTAPLEGIEVPAGINDIQVRDGSDVLATGLLTVPKGASMVATVHHP